MIPSIITNKQVSQNVNTLHVPFIVSPSTETLSHRKPSPAGTSPDRCHVLFEEKRDTF